MKRNFLLTLLLTLLPFVGWAEGETIVNTNGTAGYVVLPNGGVAADALAVKIGTATKVGEAIYASDGVTAVSGNITEVGNYFLKVVDSESLYPFQAAVEAPTTSYEIIDGPDAWNASAGAVNGGTGDGKGLKLYYAATDDPAGWSQQNQNASKPYWEDMWCYRTNRVPSVWNEAPNEGTLVAPNSDNGADRGDGNWYQVDQNGFWVLDGAVRCWGGAIKARIPQDLKDAGYKSKFPWIVFDFEGAETGASYKPVLVYTDDNVLKATPWANGKFGKGEGLRLWGVASIPVEFEKPDWSMNPDGWQWEGDAPEYNWYYEGTNDSEFNKQKLRVLLFPAEEPNATLLRDYAWTMTPTVVAYNAQAQAPTITVTAVNLAGETVTIPATNATDNSVNWTVKYYKTGTTAEVGEMVDKGVYDVKVFDAANAQIGEAQTFTITAFQLTVGSSVSYKQIGDPDPDPAYSLLYDNAPEAVKAEAANLKITGLKLTRSYPEQNPIANDKVGDQIACFIEMIDAKVVEVIEGEEVENKNYQIGTSSVNTWLKVTQKLIDKNFTIELAQNEFTYDKSEKKPAIVVKYKGTDVTDQFDLEATVYENNIAANAYGKAENTGREDEPVWVNNWIDGKPHATATATPKANGKYAYEITTVIDNKTQTLYTDLDETAEGNQLLTEEFKIKQRQIVAADLSDVSAKIFKNADWEPEVTVSFENTALTPSTVTLSPDAVESTPADYTLTFTNNKWVGTASYTVEATKAEGKYTGNYWDKVEKTFAINKYQFVLQPTPGQGKLYGTTGAENLTAEGVPAENMPVLTDITLNDDGKLVGQQLAQIVAEGYTVKRSPADVNEVGIYAVTINGAKLKKSTPESEDPAVSDPAHNFEMTVVDGEFAIFNEDEYFVSSKGVTREFESNNVSVPFDGFYVYRKTQTSVGGARPPRTRDLYVLIPKEDAAELYAEIAERVKANALVTEPDVTIIQLQATNSPYRINPVINNDVVSSYKLSVLPETVTYVDGSNVNYVTRDVFTQEGEGTLTITPRTIKIVPDDQTSVFGETLADLTYKVYGKATDGTVTKELTGFSFVEGQSTTANTIGFWQGLTSDALTYVPTAAMTEDKEFDIVVNNQNGITSGNPNYNITFEKGTYTLTPSTKAIEIAVTWTKAFGSNGNPVATLTATMGTDEYTSEHLPNPENLGYTPKEGQPVGQSVGSVPVDVTGGPAIIDGYPVHYTGTFTTTSGEALTIIVANQFPVYPTAPKTDFAAPYVKVTGPTTVAALAEEGLKIKFAKPELGYVTNGADLQVECGTGNDAVAFGTAAGYTLTDADKTGAWAWANNFASVTIKSGKARPTAADEITLDIAAFNKPKADATYTMAQIEAIGEKNDELIRDYHDYAKGIKVKVVCSLQNFEFQGDTWYSMVLPFDATPRQIAGIFGGFAAVDVLNENTSAQKASDLVFKLTMQTVDANTPFIVKTDVKTQIGAAITFTLEEGDKILYPLDRDADGKLTGKAKVADNNNNEFVGTYTGVNGFETSTNYLLMSLKGSLSPATTTAYVRPLGAYFYLPGGKNAETRIFIEEPDGSVTAIGGVNADETNAEGIYNLSGQRVNKAQKGIFIKDGKKVLVK